MTQSGSQGGILQQEQCHEYSDGQGTENGKVDGTRQTTRSQTARGAERGAGEGTEENHSPL